MIQKKTTSWYYHFSDSQSAIGILTLGWSNSSHKKTAEDIRRLISDYEKSRLGVSIKWALGHADTRGICIADELGKEAAKEVKLIPEDSQILTGADFKKFASVSCCMKWQRSWDASNTGRHLYDYKPTVSLHVGPFHRRKEVIS